MTHHWDEFSKSLAQPLPRRESLRRLGMALAGVALSPLGLRTASGGHRSKQQQSDPCKSFCKCRNKKQQDRCLKVCNACGKDPSRLGGSCGGYFCCSPGLSACGSYCTNLASDPYNCGACGYVCDEPGPYEYGACIDGRCEYACAEGAVYCNGFCTFLGWDPYNCGGCGNVCPGSAPYCNQGTCRACPTGQVLCDGRCVDLASDPDNCGACGNVCGGGTPYCTQGACTNCGGYGAGFCDGVCVNLLSNNAHCGACGVHCAYDELCTFGACIGTCSGC
jgi:hypothetical protein